MQVGVIKDMHGFIFRCTSETEKECFDRKLFGEKREYLSLVKQLKVGDTLFLYNCSNWKLMGVFEAVSDGDENIETNAWGGKFPAQIRFRVKKETKPITLDDLRGIVNTHGLYPYPELDDKKVDKIIKVFKSK